MVASVIDTLAYSKKLQAAGVPAEVADAHAEALAEVVYNRFVVKEDVSKVCRELQDVRTELKRDIAGLQKEVQINGRSVEFSTNKSVEYRLDTIVDQLTIRLGCIMAAGVFFLALLH